VTAGQHHASHGQEDAVVRPRHHVENIRRDATRAADEIAAEDGTEHDYLIIDAISWALGERDQAPITGRPTLGGADRADVDAEIAACRAYLRSTPWSEEADDPISRAQDVLKILEWLTGADDKPPTYRRETEPGDLVGGRGLIIRPYTEITRMILLANGKLAAGTTSLSLGADWHQGVIATLTWASGDRATPPMAHDGPAPACTHPASSGPPGPRDIARERGAAEEHLEPLGYKHGDIAVSYADAVACTIRWLYGETTTPPVTDDS
jgi:hypothetical protein